MTTLKELRYKASRTKLRAPKAWWEHRGLNDKDVLFASFERSGNTWLRFVLMEILTKGDAGFLNVNQVLPEMGTHREMKPVLPNGGRGAVNGMDGQSTIAFPGNGTIPPAEIIENLSPLIVLERSLRQDSGGAESDAHKDPGERASRTAPCGRRPAALNGVSLYRR